LKEYNKAKIANNFSKASEDYDNFASVQKLSAKKLCELTLPFFSNIKKEAQAIDLGSGTSAIAKEIVKKDIFLQKNINLTEVDISQEMLLTWLDKKFYNINTIKADIEKLPFKKSSCDLIFSSFALQWIINFNKTFAELNRLMQKDAILSFCIPNNESFKELKDVSLKSGCNFNFNELPEVEILRSSLAKNSFREELYFSEKISSDFKSPIDALKSFKKIGANYVNSKNFVSKKQLQKFNEFLGDKFTISWNVSYFILRKI